MWPSAVHSTEDSVNAQAVEDELAESAAEAIADAFEAQLQAKDADDGDLDYDTFASDSAAVQEWRCGGEQAA